MSKKSMPVVYRSLGTIAAAATAATMPAVDTANAQVVATNWNGYYVGLEGGFLRSHHSKPFFPPDKVGLPGPDRGGYAGFSIGRAIDPFFDWRVSAAANFFRNNERSGSVVIVPVFGADFFESSRLNFQTLDFDLGRRWQTGMLNMRAFAGLRGLHVSDVSSASVNGGVIKLGDFATSEHKRSTYWGVGPRLGLEFFYGTTWGIVGSVSASAMYGPRRSESTFINPFAVKGSPTVTFFSERTHPVITNVQGMIGLGWQATPTTFLTAGYKFDHWQHIIDEIATRNNKGDNASIHTFYIGARFGLGVPPPPPPPP